MAPIYPKCARKTGACLRFCSPLREHVLSRCSVSATLYFPFNKAARTFKHIPGNSGHPQQSNIDGGHGTTARDPGLDCRVWFLAKSSNRIYFYLVNHLIFYSFSKLGKKDSWQKVNVIFYINQKLCFRVVPSVTLSLSGDAPNARFNC